MLTVFKMMNHSEGSSDSERVEQNLDTASPAPTESTEGGYSKMTARQFSLEVVEQKLDVGSSVTEGSSPSEVTTQLDSSDRGVVLPESLEIFPIIDAPSSERLAVMSSGIQHGNERIVSKPYTRSPSP